MTNNFIVNIGIEIHISLNTKSKMFSAAPNNFNAPVNKNISIIDLAYPGTMPTVNKEAVIKAIKFAKALKMKINKKLYFDRKHYFYYDLPRGFQITQHFHPIATSGTIKINNKNIKILKIQLEEDTAKSLHYDNKTFLNYNRSGIPLIEVITPPIISSASEVGDYIKAIKQLARFLQISNAKMEEGSLRADLNISVRSNYQKELGTKVEIKNINSISNAIKATQLEILKQKNDLLKGLKIKQTTKYYNDQINKNVTMRIKKTVADYKYFPEPNLPPINLTESFINAIKITNLPWDITAKFRNLGFNDDIINQLINDDQKLTFLEKIKYEDLTKSVRIFFAEIVALANKERKKINELKIDPSEIKYILQQNKLGNLSGFHIKKIIPLLVGFKKASEIIKKYRFKQISNEKKIKQIIDLVISENITFINQNKAKKERVCKFIIGKVMQASKGQFNPISVNKLVRTKMDLLPEN